MATKNEKIELKKWDFSKVFSAFEIACLIQGIDPSLQSESLMVSDPIYRRVCCAYQDILITLAGFPCEDMNAVMKDGLAPRRLYDKRKHALEGGEIPDEDGELHKHPFNQLQSVRFERHEITRWLKHLKLTSVYSFTPHDLTPQDWRTLARETVNRHSGNKSAAARELGITQQRVSQLLETTKKAETRGSKSSDSGAQALQGAWSKSLK
jgi:hypothetical protein